MNEPYSSAEIYEWMAILRASQDNLTLKELVDELRVLYNASKETEQHQEVYQEDIWKGIVLV